MSNPISVILTSDQREQLQMAAMIASVGAVSGSDVSVFVSMNALKYFVNGQNHKAPAQAEMGRLLDEKNAPDFIELFEQAVEYGDAKVYPCSMAVDILEVDKNDLKSFVSEPLGLTAFLSDSENAQVWNF